MKACKRASFALIKTLCMLFVILTSISSLYLSRGASIMLRSLNVSVSTSKVCPVTLVQNHTRMFVKMQKKKSAILTKRPVVYVAMYSFESKLVVVCSCMLLWPQWFSSSGATSWPCWSWAPTGGSTHWIHLWFSWGPEKPATPSELEAACDTC